MEKTPKIILECVCNVTGQTIKEIKGKSRKKDVIQARHIAVYLLLKYTKLLSGGVGKLFGRNHSTVLNSKKVVDNSLWVLKRCHKSTDICMALNKTDSLLTEVTREAYHNSIILSENKINQV